MPVPKPKLRFLTPREVKTVNAFAADIKKVADDKLVQIVLFGSKARGDYVAESDIDILIVLKSEDRELVDEIFSILIDYKIETELYLAPIIYGLKDYELSRSMGSEFIKNAENEGIPL